MGVQFNEHAGRCGHGEIKDAVRKTLRADKYMRLREIMLSTEKLLSRPALRNTVLRALMKLIESGEVERNGAVGKREYRLKNN